MKFLNDYFSILCFFIAWVLTKSVYTATKVGIIASALQVLVLALKYRRFTPVRWAALTLFFWAVFGGLTLAFHDQRFIQWKPTILYWVFGLAFLLSQFWPGDNLYKRMLSSKISLPDAIWNKLNASWVGFFMAMGVLNLVVVYGGFSFQFWVYYKIFGTIALTLVFALSQAVYLNKYVVTDEDNGEVTNHEQ